MKIIKKEYWVYDSIESDYIFYDDPDARDEMCAEIIESCRDEGMWELELLDDIKCGISFTTHEIVQTDVIMRPDKIDPDGYDEQGVYWPKDWYYICDYKMKEI